MRLALKTTEIGGAVNIFDSEQRRFLTGGITIDSTKVSAVNGEKILRAGRVMGKNAGTGKYEPLTDAVAAKLATGVVGSNNAITFTSKTPGTASESIKIQLKDPSANSQDLAVSVAADTIVVSLKTGSAGAIESTAAQVIAAVNAHLVAKTLVSAANTGASTGAGVVAAVAATALDDGGDWNVTPSCLLAEDVDLTSGDVAASAVDVARVISARLPVEVKSEVKAVLSGIAFV